MMRHWSSVVSVAQRPLVMACSLIGACGGDGGGGLGGGGLGGGTGGGGVGGGGVGGGGVGGGVGGGDGGGGLGGGLGGGGEGGGAILVQKHNRCVCPPLAAQLIVLIPRPPCASGRAYRHMLLVGLILGVFMSVLLS